MTISTTDYILLDSQNSNGVGNHIGTRIYGTTANTSDVAQATSRTTGVTINAAVGTITLVSAAGSATHAAFTVTNSFVAANDVVVVTVKTATDPRIAVVTATAAGSFVISTATLSGTTTETPVLNFVVIKAAIV